MTSLIHLQAAMALGLFIMLIAVFLLILIIPLTFVFSGKIRIKKQQKKETLELKDRIFSGLEGFALALLIIGATGCLFFIAVEWLFRDAIL